MPTTAETIFNLMAADNASPTFVRIAAAADHAARSTEAATRRLTTEFDRYRCSTCRTVYVVAALARQCEARHTDQP